MQLMSPAGISYNLLLMLCWQQEQQAFSLLLEVKVKWFQLEEDHVGLNPMRAGCVTLAAWRGESFIHFLAAWFGISFFPSLFFTFCLAPFYHLKGNAKRHLGLTVPSLSSGGGLLCPSNYQWWTRGRKRKQRWKMNIQLTSSFPWWHLLLCHATAFQNLTHIYMPLRGRACVCCPVKSQARIYMLCWIGAIYPSFSLTLRATLRFCWSNKTEHTHRQKEETRERKCIY